MQVTLSNKGDCIVLSNVFNPTRKSLECIAVTLKTQIHEGRRGYIHGGSREYTHDRANTFTLVKHKFLRHTHERRHHTYYNVVLRSLPRTSIYKMHEGVGGCEGRRVIQAADLSRAKLLIL